MTLERARPRLDARTGLTVIEVLVALALLGIISAAIVGMFAVLNALNRGASEDVDYGRVVRSITERTLNDWRNPSQWNASSVDGTPIAQFVATQTGNRCAVGVTTPDIVQVRVVTITCPGTQVLGEQVYEFEVGSPLE